MTTKVRQSLGVVATAATLIATGLGLSACGNDAKVVYRNKVPAEKINMPETYDTIADKCDGHGFRVYENGHGLYAVRDPKCSGYGSETTP